MINDTLLEVLEQSGKQQRWNILQQHTCTCTLFNALPPRPKFLFSWLIIMHKSHSFSSTVEFNYGQHIADIQYLSRPLLTFNVADVWCCNERMNLANVSMPYSKRSLPPRLNSHVHIIMFMHTAMIFIILPQLFCWASNFSQHCFFLVKFKTLGLMVEPGLATKLCAKALSTKWRKFF